MPKFRYIASAPGGRSESFEIEADAPREALAKLRSRGLVPIRFCGEAESGGGVLRRRGPRFDCGDFTGQLAVLLKANIPLERALAIIAEGAAPDSGMAQFCMSLRQGLHEGRKFSELIRSQGAAFPGFYANLIETGEETGCLPEVTAELRRFLDESRELKEFIVSSSIYPIAVLFIVAAVTILMFTVFVPRFSRIFADMGRELPGSMVFLAAAGDGIGWGCLILPVAALGLWWGLRRTLGEEKFADLRSRAALRIPIFGKLRVELEIGKFMRTFAILAANHVDIIKTVRIAIRVIGNRTVRAGFAHLEGRIRGGEKLSAALRGNPFLPPGLASKIRVGEESGDVGAMLAASAAAMEEASRRKIKRLLSLFEPVVIVFLAGMVLIVVVSIFMAIMEINQVS